MRLRAADLAGSLGGRLAPAYLVTGDDALLVQEACDAIIDAARDRGFAERSVLHAERGFNWNDVIQDAASMSLFAERRIIDVRVPSGKFDREASEALRRYAGHPPDDTLLLIRSPRLDSKQSKSAWFKALDKLGVIVTVWGVDLQDLPRWLAGRLKHAGLKLEKEALALLAERVEGNLLAAVQEIRKLELAGLESPVSAEALSDVLDDSARYDTFQLMDAALTGDAPRIVRMVRTLRQEGVSPFAVLGALTSFLRRYRDRDYLPDMRKRMVGAWLGRNGGTATIDRVLAQAALVDAQGKGQIPGDPWQSLEDLLLRMAGVRAVAATAPVKLLRN